MPPKSKPHKQVRAKVTAYGDKGIKDLVEVLNEFDKVQTTDSCEGDNDGYAYVFMYYGATGKPNLHETIDFAQYMVDAIREAVLKSKTAKLAGTTTEISVSIEWQGRSFPLVVIEMPKDAINPITNVFAALLHEFSCNKEDKQE